MCVYVLLRDGAGNALPGRTLKLVPVASLSSDTAPYLDGSKAFTIPMYVVAGRDAANPVVAPLYEPAAAVPSLSVAPAEGDAAPAAAPAADRIALCPNVTVLGRSGVATIAGVSVAWVSGTFDAALYSGSAADVGRAHYTSTDVQAVVGASQEPGFRGVDLLLTSEWPQKCVR